MSRFSTKISLGKKLAISLSLVALSISALVGGVYWEYLKIWEITNNVYDLHDKRISALEQSIRIYEGLERVSGELRSRRVSAKQSSREMDLVKIRIKAFKDELSGYKIFPDEVFRLELILRHLKALEKEIPRNRNLVVYLNQIQIESSEVFGVLEKFLSIKIDDEYRRLYRMRDEGLVIGLWLFGLCLIVIMYVGFRMNLQIKRSVTQLIEFTQNVSQGYLNQKMEVKDEDEIGLLVKSFNEMTENLARAGDILDKRDQLKDEFVSVVSHEIRTPIAILQRVVENLRNGIAGELNAEQNQMVQIADNNIQRLSALIKNLLDIARLESGKLKMHPEKMNLGHLVEQLAPGFRELADQKGLKFDFEIEKDLPLTVADADLMGQVITNFFNNALRYAKSQVLVRVQTIPKKGDRCLEVSVVDDGPGIDEQGQKVLFDKFIQVNREKGGQGYKGTGLGLAICKQIIDQHEGHIGVRSELGQGSIFYFEINKI